MGGGGGCRSSRRTRGGGGGGALSWPILLALAWGVGWVGGREGEFCPYYSQQQAGPPPQLSNRELAPEGQVAGA
jgi:hypothetical protein